MAVDLFGCPGPDRRDPRRSGCRSSRTPRRRPAPSLDGAPGRDPRRTPATFSFYPSKNLGAFGDGGAIVTDDDAVADLARALRFHGSRDKRTFEHVGYNSRLDELQAAILRLLLPELDGWCDGRRAAAQAYAEAGIEQYVTPARRCPRAPVRPGICTWSRTRRRMR